jgi:hypothetical protein
MAITAKYEKPPSYQAVKAARRPPAVVIALTFAEELP